MADHFAMVEVKTKEKSREAKVGLGGGGGYYRDEMKGPEERRAWAEDKNIEDAIMQSESSSLTPYYILRKLSTSHYWN